MVHPVVKQKALIVPNFNLSFVTHLKSPKATHLSNISMKKRTAKTMFTIFRMNISSSLSCRLMSSKHSDKLRTRKGKSV